MKCRLFLQYLMTKLVLCKYVFSAFLIGYRIRNSGNHMDNYDLLLGLDRFCVSCDMKSDAVLQQEELEIDNLHTKTVPC